MLESEGVSCGNREREVREKQREVSENQLYYNELYLLLFIPAIMLQPPVGINQSSATTNQANSVASCFWANVRDYSAVEAFAIAADDEVRWLNWYDLGLLAARWVSKLQRLSLEPGAHVASALPNSLDWILLDLAAQTLGLVHVAIDLRESPQQQRYLFEFSEARHLFDRLIVRPQDESAHNLLSPEDCANLANKIDPHAAAQMLFTSGTDGRPKGVVLSHHNLLTNARAKLGAAPQLSRDLRLNILPFAHAYARTCELSSWIISGSRLAIAHSWADVVRQAPELRPTLINVVPYLAERMALLLEDKPQALGDQLRLLQVGGAAIDDRLWQRLAKLGLPPLQGYGLTEAAPVVCSNRAGSQRPGSVGPPVAGIELRVDAAGVLWCCGPNVMLGYWRNNAATRQSVVDGWLSTGDLAEIEPNGSVKIFGRAAQQIVLSTGYKVSPELIERELCREIGIERAVVFGGGRPYAVALLWSPEGDVQTQPTAINPQLMEHWRARIAARLKSFPSHAIPRQFTWIEQPLSVESGLLTVKGSLRRTEIAAHYRESIESLYARK